MFLWFQDSQQTSRSAISTGLCTVLPDTGYKFPFSNRKVETSKLLACCYMVPCCSPSPEHAEHPCSARPLPADFHRWWARASGQGQAKGQITLVQAVASLFEVEISWFCLAKSKTPQAFLFSLSPHPLGFSFSMANTSVSWRDEQMMESVPPVNDQHYIHNLVWFCSSSLLQWCRWEGINFMEDNSVN